MQVILLDKVANLGSTGDQVNVKAGYARNFWSRRVKLFLLPRKTLNSSKHVVLNWKPNWLTFWQQLKLVLSRSTPRIRNHRV